MIERINPFAVVLGIVAAMAIIAVCAAALVGPRITEERERDCEAICSARQSACRAVTAWGPLCHDGSMPGRCP